MGSCFSNSAPPSTLNPAKMEETTVCHSSDLEVGQMKEFKFDNSEQTCLLIKTGEGKLEALSGKCTHYGASLSKGSYSDGVIRCPWHGACFNAASGDIEDFPGLDSLQKFDVSTNDKGDVVVRANPHILKETRRVQPLCKRNPDNEESVVVIGGGAAAEVSMRTFLVNDRGDTSLCFMDFRRAPMELRFLHIPCYFPGMR